ncbi:hypothetical protein A9Q94_02675 [Rhodobacterales bacterium 56_14_T64]|nr:hypothetical protein A9Q94_02675 [Rhodobacterales bacterium 56_14_T64]
MTFTVSFSDEVMTDQAKGSISLGDNLETFYSDLRSYSCEEYKAQWKAAISTSMRERRTTTLFKSVDLDGSGVGRLWLYSIVPSEIAGDTPKKQTQLEDFPACISDGVYLTERFMNVTVRHKSFNKRIYLQYEDGTFGEELALYFLDLAAPERFFGYLDDNVCHISHWYSPNSDLQNFLSHTA